MPNDDFQEFVIKLSDWLNSGRAKGRPIMAKTPSDHWISELVRTVQECRAENQDQRFGQLLFNLISHADGKRGREYNEDFHMRLFNITNEELVELLRKYGQDGEL